MHLDFAVTCKVIDATKTDEFELLLLQKSCDYVLDGLHACISFEKSEWQPPSLMMFVEEISVQNINVVV
jgi:hypothetical protein